MSVESEVLVTGRLARLRARLRGRFGENGAIAIEYALLVPAFLLLVLGSMDVGRLIFTQVTLERAAQAAARCGAVNSACKAGTPPVISTSAVQAFAVDQAWGVPTTTTNFAVTTPACGVQVAASYPYHFITPWLVSPDRTVTAQACYPINP